MNRVLSSLLIALPIGAFISGCVPQEQNLSTALEGAWESNCFYDEEDNDYSKYRMIYKGNKVDVFASVYLDSDCENELSYTFYVFGTFQLGDEIELSSGDKAMEIDYQFSNGDESEEFKDIIQIKGDEYRYGNSVDSDMRPTEIDKEVFYTRL